MRQGPSKMLFSVVRFSSSVIDRPQDSLLDIRSILTRQFFFVWYINKETNVFLRPCSMRMQVNRNLSESALPLRGIARMKQQRFVGRDCS
jgi:hypothetical protein